jgi:acetyltransferase-like isoleucine patch superfamily enzyme
MSYYTSKELKMMGFKWLGKNVKISTKASVYDCGQIEVGDNSRIDDFCVISGKISMGKNVHIAPYCLLAGGEKGIVLEDFSGLAYKVQVFTQSDDYSGKSMTNPTVPAEYKNEVKKEVVIKRHVIVGAGSMILPGVVLDEGTAVGAMSLVRKNTTAWSVYLGNPARKLKNRSQDLLELEKQYLSMLNK